MLDVYRQPVICCSIGRQMAKYSLSCSMVKSVCGHQCMYMGTMCLMGGWHARRHYADAEAVRDVAAAVQPPPQASGGCRAASGQPHLKERQRRIRYVHRQDSRYGCACPAPHVILRHSATMVPTCFDLRSVRANSNVLRPMT